MNPISDPRDNGTPNTRYDTLLAICQGRKSTRDFAERPVHPDDIERILAIARTAPYASGKKNWDIIVVSDPALRARMVEVVRQRTAQIEAKVRDSFRTDFAVYAENFSAFATAPAILIPTFRIAPSLSLMYTDADAATRQWEHDNFVKSIACVGMLALLAAESIGLAGCFMTGALLAADELAVVVGAKPGRRLAALIPIGYRKEEP
jgi:nitroreductase